jgi:hypothetical protein
MRKSEGAVQQIGRNFWKGPVEEREVGTAEAGRKGGVL